MTNISSINEKSATGPWFISEREQINLTCSRSRNEEMTNSASLCIGVYLMGSASFGHNPAMLGVH